MRLHPEVEQAYRVFQAIRRAYEGKQCAPAVYLQARKDFQAIHKRHETPTAIPNGAPEQ